MIANLEHTLGVRLFDRSPRGVEPTLYGNALLKRSLAAFDELRQGVRDIESLSDPTCGELRFGCSVSVAATILPAIIQRFSKTYPRVILHMEEVPPPSQDLAALRDREFDFILGRMVTSLADNLLGADVNVEFLFDDPLVIVAGVHNPWIRRRKVDLAELVDEPWILTPPETWHYSRMAEAFRARGLGVPNFQLLSLSVPLRVQLLANGRYVTALAKTVAKQYGLTILPVDLPSWPCPVVFVTLKNRTLSPVVERFIESVRKFTLPMRGK